MNKKHRSWSSARWLAAVFLGTGLSITGEAAEQGVAAQRQVTFTKDIAPILQRSCENCHRAGGVGPMALSTYEDVRPWVRAIRQRTAAREMPPWFIEKNVGIQRFKDDPSLTDAEIRMIATWADSGAPRGNPADMPPRRQYGRA
jgi:mono/diheme cytochrome c family protein